MLRWRRERIYSPPVPVVCFQLCLQAERASNPLASLFALSCPAFAADHLTTLPDPPRWVFLVFLGPCTHPTMQAFGVDHALANLAPHVARSRPFSHFEAPTHNSHVNSTVFVGNLSWSTTSDDLRAFMASLGEVVSAEVQSHADSGRSKGWG